MDSLFDIALDIKSDVATYAENIGDAWAEPNDWFGRQANFSCKSISREEIDKDAGDSHNDWFDLCSDYIEYKNNGFERFKKWISDLTVNDLADILKGIPGMVNNHIAGRENETIFEFTPMQRLFIHVASQRPFSMTASVLCTSENIEKLQYGDVVPPNARRRKQIARRSSIMSDDVPEFVVMSLATYSGKTAISLGMALYLLASKFSQVLGTFKRRMAGRVFNGPEVPRILRVAIVCAPASTLQHFVDTAKGLLHAWKQSHPGFKYKLWLSAGQTRTSFELASREPDTVFFWFLPPEKLYEVLKSDSQYGASVCIIDEFPPNYRDDSAISPIACTIFNQATLDIWKRSGKSHILGRQLFNGNLIAPGTIHELIHSHSFTQASLAMQQLCALSLVESGSFFREAIRRELQQLVPESLLIVDVKCRRLTMASAIVGAETDLVPVTICDSIMSHLLNSHRHLYDPSGIDELRQRLEGAENLTPATILESLNLIRLSPNCAPHNMDDWQERINVVVDRLRGRIQEFVSDDCPICMSRPEDAEFCVMNCCGMFLCGGCRQQCANRNNKCPQCRAPLRRGFFPDEVRMDPAQAVEEPENADYPDFPDPSDLPRMPLSVNSEMALQAMLEARTDFTRSQTANVVIALQCLRICGYVRPLIICETIKKETTVLIDVPRVARQTDYTIKEVNGTLSGRGSRFVELKKEFDNPATEPMALMCVGELKKFLVGTNLDFADCLLSIGSIPQGVLRQAFGRVFRPRRSRNNNLAIPFVNVRL
jgi:hypothetical protein